MKLNKFISDLNMFKLIIINLIFLQDKKVTQIYQYIIKHPQCSFLGLKKFYQNFIKNQDKSGMGLKLSETRIEPQLILIKG
jgi:hypothetical protein